MATIQKRNNTYKITVSCGYDLTGKQIRRIMTWEPLPGMTQKQAEKEANKQAVLFEQQVNNGFVATDGRIKLGEFCPQYLENVKSQLAPYTLARYKKMIDICIIPYLGHMKLKDIKTVHVQKFVNELQKEGARFDGKPGTLSPASVRRYYVMLQSILHNAYKMDLIACNPADSDKITLPSVGEQKTEIFTKEEIQVLLERLEAEPLQFRTLIHLALNTGCRRGELCGLQWKDINYSKSTLTVSRSNYKLKGEEIKSKATKTNKTRIITIPPYCLKMLKSLKAEQAQTRLMLGDKWQGEDWIFTQADGKPMYPTTPTMIFDKFLKRNNLPHRKFHALRHTSATLLLSSGTNIKNVASRLGHSQLTTTNRYVHAVEEADKAAANTFENMFSTMEKQA